MRHKHRLSNYRMFTADLGQLVPIGLTEVLPGDVFRHSTSVMVRLAPMAAPVMHPMRVRVHHFFVPHRLSWPDNYAVSWEDFITGGPNNDVTDPVPVVTTTGVAKDLLDYLGLPQVASVEVSSLPLRAFNLVFNEWFRDQDLVTERDLEATDVPNVAWEKDYYTTARPWPQRGPDVTLPIGDRAPVMGIGTKDQGYTAGPTTVYETGQTAASQFQSYKTANIANDPNTIQIEEDPTNAGFPGIWADLSNATASKVNDIRRAFALQRFAEVRARFGARYSEYLRYLGANPPDARLQRPEFLGGGVSSVNISEVLQTAPEGTGRTYGVGDLYGHGIAASRSNAYRRRFHEHGYVISTCSIRPKQIFTQGIEKTFLRQDREDFWQQELQFIGQQEVMQQELFADGTNKDTVFGWSDRYEEYRHQRSLAVGEFRDLLDYWHLGREFASAPVLNESFVKCVPSKRIFNEQTQNSLWCAANHSLVCRRLVSKTASGRLF